MAEITAEHRAVAQVEAREILERVLRGEPKPVMRVKTGEKWSHPIITGLKRGENLRNHGPVHDYDEIVRVFQSEPGKTIADTARQLGIDRSTVSSALKKAGLSSPPGRRPNKKEN